MAERKVPVRVSGAMKAIKVLVDVADYVDDAADLDDAIDQIAIDLQVALDPQPAEPDDDGIVRPMGVRGR